MTEILLSSEKFIKEVTSVSDNLAGKYLLPSLLEAQEVALLQEAGARTVTLGKRILRTETAGLAALASVLTLTGDL